MIKLILFIAWNIWSNGWSIIIDLLAIDFVIFNVSRVSFFQFSFFLSSPTFHSRALPPSHTAPTRSLALAVFIASGRIESIYLRIKSIMWGRESRLVIIISGLTSDERFCYRNSTEYIIYVKRPLLSFSRNKETTNFCSFSSPLFTV